MNTSLWFEAIDHHENTIDGDLTVPDATRVLYRTPIFCTELCGASNRYDRNGGHATMLAEILVMHPSDFDRWVQADCTLLQPTTGSEWGEMLFSQRGCAACHARTADATELEGPSLHGLFGRLTSLRDGETVVIDEAYVRESILEPQVRVTSGYENTMPHLPVSEEELDGLIAYLRTL